MSMSTSCVPYDVLVVGAGASGLSAAAHVLKRRPASRVLIVEADARIGGRIESGSVGGKPVDFGAAWVHGDAPIEALSSLDGYRAITRNAWLHANEDLVQFCGLPGGGDGACATCAAGGEAKSACVGRGIAAFAAARSALSCSEEPASSIFASPAARSGCAAADAAFAWCAHGVELWYGAPLRSLAGEDIAGEFLGDYPGPHRLPFPQTVALPVLAGGVGGGGAGGATPAPGVRLQEIEGAGMTRLIASLWSDIWRGHCAALSAAADVVSGPKAGSAAESIPPFLTALEEPPIESLLRLGCAVDEIDSTGAAISVFVAPHVARNSESKGLVGGAGGVVGFDSSPEAVPIEGAASPVLTLATPASAGSEARLAAPPLFHTPAEREKLSALAVIVTVPLNVLRKSDDAACVATSVCSPRQLVFRPPLCEEKRRALGAMRMGQYKKVMLAFEQPPLPKDTPYFLALCAPPTATPAAPRPHPRIAENYAAVKGAKCAVLACYLVDPLLVVNTSSSPPRPWTDAEAVEGFLEVLKANFPHVPSFAPTAVHVTHWESRRELQFHSWPGSCLIVAP